MPQMDVQDVSIEVGIKLGCGRRVTYYVTTYLIEIEWKSWTNFIRYERCITKIYVASILVQYSLIMVRVLFDSCLPIVEI